MKGLAKPSGRGRKPKKPLPRPKRVIGWKRREAKKASTVTDEERERILIAFGRRCAYCRIVWASEWDHFRAIARGGKDEASNIFPICPGCNQKKGTSTTWPRPAGHPFTEAKPEPTPAPRAREEHLCDDYVAEDPDDTLSFVCVCGHVEEEHEKGFFKRCKFDTRPAE